MKGYSVNIAFCNKELTAKERIAIKDTSDCVKLDTATQSEVAVVIDPLYWAELSVHNDKSENTDYSVYVIVDKNGNKYTTGSESFWTTFCGIADEMANESEEWAIKVYRLPSKNRAGKDFITCSIM